MRTFLIVWAGQFVSQIGGRLSTFALGIWVYERTRVPIEVQGRVFALNRMVVMGALVLGLALSGPLADSVFEPLMAESGALAGSVGQGIGAGPGRGIALIFLLTGAGVALASIAGWLSPRLRRVEDELPDLLDQAGVVTR